MEFNKSKKEIKEHLKMINLSIKFSTNSYIPLTVWWVNVKNKAVYQFNFFLKLYILFCE